MMFLHTGAQALQKSRVLAIVFLYLGRSNSSNAFFCVVGFFQGLSEACFVGLLLVAKSN